MAFRDVIDEAKLVGVLKSDVRSNDATAALLAIADGLVVQPERPSRKVRVFFGPAASG